MGAAAVGRTVGDLMAPLRRTAVMGEINFEVDDAAAAIDRVAAAFANAAQDRLDGLTIEQSGGWFNLRPSNTEPRLRLNLEGDDAVLRDAGLARIIDLLGEPESAS